MGPATGHTITPHAPGACNLSTGCSPLGGGSISTGLSNQSSARAHYHPVCLGICIYLIKVHAQRISRFCNIPSREVPARAGQNQLRRNGIEEPFGASDDDAKSLRDDGVPMPDMPGTEQGDL